MFTTLMITTNCNEKPTMDTWSKQTQTKPILEGILAKDRWGLILKHIFEGAVVGFSGAEGGDLFEFNDSADIVQA